MVRKTNKPTWESQDDPQFIILIIVFILTADFRGWISIVEVQSKVDSRYCGCPLCFNLTPKNNRLAFDSYIKIDQDFTPKTFKRMIYICLQTSTHYDVQTDNRGQEGFGNEKL